MARHEPIVRCCPTWAALDGLVTGALAEAAGIIHSGSPGVARAAGYNSTRTIC